MNKKLELDMSEFLLAIFNDNSDRSGRILNRLGLDQREKLAKALINGLHATLYTLPGGTILALKKEYNFDIDIEVQL